MWSESRSAIARLCYKGMVTTAGSCSPCRCWQERAVDCVLPVAPGSISARSRGQAVRNRGAMKSAAGKVFLECAHCNRYHFSDASQTKCPAQPDAAGALRATFIDAQMRRIFEDGKSFVDALPLTQPPEALRGLYEAGRLARDFSLSDFVQQHFALPDLHADPGGIAASDGSPWPRLLQERREAMPGDSLLPLPRPYVVPGGRYRELYYWDSYFTMLGLLADGQRGLAEDIVANFAHLLDRHGFIPNASRSYMLSRSQPPFFFGMVALLHAGDEAAGFATFFRNCAWNTDSGWTAPRALRPAMRIAASCAWPTAHCLIAIGMTTPGRARNPGVMTCSPRWPAPAGSRGVARSSAASESGWDFSSRWYDDPLVPGDRGNIHTTAILPVDLNSLLHGLESAIAAGAARAGRRALAADFRRRASERQAALQRRFWSARSGHFVDLDRRRPASTSRTLTAAGLLPLFLGLATPAQARTSAIQVRERLLGAEGLLAVPAQEGQPGNAPASWPPLQWISVQGLWRYGQTRWRERSRSAGVQPSSAATRTAPRPTTPAAGPAASTSRCGAACLLHPESLPMNSDNSLQTLVIAAADCRLDGRCRLLQTSARSLSARTGGIRRDRHCRRGRGHHTGHQAFQPFAGPGRRRVHARDAGQLQARHRVRELARAGRALPSLLRPGRAGPGSGALPPLLATTARAGPRR